MDRVYDILSLDGRVLEKFEDFQNDPTAVLIAVKEHAGAFIYASDELKHNERFVIQAIAKIHMFYFMQRHFKETEM